MNTTYAQNDVSCLMAHASHAIQERRYTEALSLLQVTLQDLKTLQEQDQPSQQARIPSSHLKLRVLPLRESFDRIQSFHADHRAFAMFDGALSFDSWSETESSPPEEEPSESLLTEEETLAIWSAVALYNLALLYHVTAIGVCTSKQESFLSKAQHFYFLAGRIHSDCFRKCTLMDLAICNNVAHVSLLLADLSGLFSCLHSLAVMLESPCDSSMLNDKDTWSVYSHFRINEFLFRGNAPFNLPAAAA